jgi:membrane associated rhomboid family serine protease
LNTVSLRPPADWKRARVTVALLVLTIAAWLVVSMFDLAEWAVVWAGFIPARLHIPDDGSVAPFWLTPLTAAFVHANPLHLVFNMIFLAFIGRATEAVLGPLAMIVLYVVGAYAAAAVQYLMEPNSLTPMIGASGAISAWLGAYAILFGRNKVRVRSPRLALLLHALWLLAAWVVLNVVVMISFVGMAGLQIAAGAHIGGFIPGLILAVPLLLLRYRKA